MGNCIFCGEKLRFKDRYKIEGTNYECCGACQSNIVMDLKTYGFIDKASSEIISHIKLKGPDVDAAIKAIRDNSSYNEYLIQQWDRRKIDERLEVEKKIQNAAEAKAQEERKQPEKENQEKAFKTFILTTGPSIDGSRVVN